ncbi:hypothetical protein N7510_010012 [Penicillium lagena]|uniref:uncharacterized protein n=1 Tax=Penicillium lagena TaxID=94218 RepID=UPI0025424989|nr:uncharacterized protein N7510_010012 [Penicillium lagena]KAJ5604858.1 hypothetical protein N7510_010012 [Penicillium lagena]
MPSGRIKKQHTKSAPQWREASPDILIDRYVFGATSVFRLNENVLQGWLSNLQKIDAAIGSEKSSVMKPILPVAGVFRLAVLAMVMVFGENGGAVLPRSIGAPVLATSALEKEYFDWFRNRTVPKLPGSFISEFWSRLLLQSSLTEPAILHASLALSAVHKAGATDSNRYIKEQMKQFALHNYVKAIDHLHPHFAAKNRVSFQTILIACVIFVSLEFLRGHFGTAQSHLQNGFKIIKETNLFPVEHGSIPVSLPQRSVAEDWIMEAFFRLHVQVGLFKEPDHGSDVAFQKNERVSLPRKFLSLKEAWQLLDSQMHETLRLAHLNRQHNARDAYSPCYPPSTKQQKETLKRLEQWHTAYKSSSQAIKGQGSLDEQKAYLILGIYHTMTTIMAELCSYPDNEMASDTQIHQFAHLMKQMENLHDVSRAEWDAISVDDRVNISRSIVDMGCIAPLYYVAVKCRVHRLRIQAVQLLESVFHREGIWDARATASVARKVVELEEGDYFISGGLSDDLSIFDCQGQPTLPEHYRIHNVGFVLSGNPAETIFLLGRRHEGKSVRSCIAEYRMGSQSWIDM